MKISNIEYRGRAYKFEYLEDIIGKVIGYDIEATVAPKPDSAAIISADPRKVKFLLDSFAQQGVTVEQVHPGVFADRYEIFTETDWAYVVVAIDDCGGIGSVFDTLRRFRDAYPHTPVILASTDFSNDDLTCERLPLADVSLKLPLVAGQLQEAMETALMNNVRWQMRVQDLRPDQDETDLPEHSEIELISVVEAE